MKYIHNDRSCGKQMKWQDCETENLIQQRKITQSWMTKHFTVKLNLTTLELHTSKHYTGSIHVFVHI
jgi:hypothetical protein